MNWTASIHEVTKSEGKATVSILFAGDTEKFVQTFVPPANADQGWLERTVRDRIAGLEEDTSFIDSLSVGMQIPVVEPPPVIPPEVDENLALFRKKAFTILRLKELVELEIIPADAAEVVAVRDEMKSLYKVGYTI